ncbi:MAG: murein L,D-transpeptidase catalytic domain family protein [Ferruginibacter sp.]
MQRFIVKKVYLFFFSVLIFMLHLPVAFSSTKPFTFLPAVSPVVSGAEVTEGAVKYSQLFLDLNLEAQGLCANAFNAAMKGFAKLSDGGKIRKNHIITIIDFKKSSTQKRMFVLDVENQKILYKTYVAHGQKSGREMANQFSNIPESYQSSLGFYETSTTYNGKNGYSLKLRGLENGINDKAEERAVVIHGAPYVSESFINSHGYLGRSWGCPALPENLNRPIIDVIKNGSCVFIYSNNNKYLNNSNLLNS